MAATVTIERTKWSPGEFTSVGTLNLGTYVTNGVAITANQFGLSSLDSLRVDPAGGLTFEFDRPNMKIKAYYPIQIVHNATPATQPVSVVAADTGLEANLGATANFAGIEALNAAALSGITARFTASGI